MMLREQPYGDEPRATETGPNRDPENLNLPRVSSGVLGKFRQL